MDAGHLINQIIPPPTYEYREGFSNIPIIDELNDDEKLQVEDVLS